MKLVSQGCDLALKMQILCRVEVFTHAGSGYNRWNESFNTIAFIEAVQTAHFMSKNNV